MENRKKTLTIVSLARGIKRFALIMDGGKDDDVQIIGL
jgi:hypothetical protein